ncbi:unnamed protein product [Phytophthora lilii]|uniref:Unnamed protein product n=1 Tax=Phytophthora lilii TaxID=2077276 RepID=A0A9W6YLY4_9STRA|nr:unnamed protein product [Phytophthora lilii]
MLLIFNEEKQCAWWRCTHAPKETQAILWFGRGRTEISVDEDAFAPDNIESFAAIAKETAKPQAEHILTEAQRLKLKLIKIVGDKYRRSYGSGAIYERLSDYYYTYKYSDPKLFLNHIFANDESYQLSSKKESDELLHVIKYTVHPGFINAADVPKGIQVRKYINQKLEITETPLFDKYFSFQFTEEEDREFIYFLIGRWLTVLDDKFDFMLMIHGQGGSGKSRLANLVKFAFGQDQIGLLSNSMQEKLV